MQLKTVLETADFLSFINGRVSASINRQLNRRFKRAGLNITTEQWSVLTSLWDKDKQTQQSICEYTFKDKASVTRLIDSLEKNNLVIRVADPNDRRTNLINLTQEGKEIEKTANKIVEEAFKLCTNNVNLNDLKFIIKVFKKITDNIEKLD